MNRALVIEGSIIVFRLNEEGNRRLPWFAETGEWVFFEFEENGWLFVTNDRHSVEEGYEERTKVLATLIAPRTYLLRDEEGTEAMVYLSRTPPAEYERDSTPPPAPLNTRRDGEEKRDWYERLLRREDLG